MSYTIKTAAQVTTDFLTYVIQKAPQISDLIPGSVLRSFGEGVGQVSEEIQIQAYQALLRALAVIGQTAFGLTQKPGTYATTTVTFTRSGSVGVQSIPSGSQGQTPSGLIFYTTADGSIADGATVSGAIPVQAGAVGTAYNVGVAAISVVSSPINGVISVTNANTATGGTDSESILAFVQRFQLYIQGLGGSQVSGLKYAALSQNGVVSVSVIENIPAISNVNVNVYIDDGSPSGVATSLVSAVQLVIDGDGALNPGYRAAGVNVVVGKPTIVTQNITLTANVTLGALTSIQAVANINAAIIDYISTLAVGDSLVIDELIASVMGEFGVVDIPSLSPSANVTITSSEVLRAGTISITVVFV